MTRRITLLVLMVLLLILQVQMWVGRGSVQNVGRLQRQLEDQKLANTRVRLSNDLLLAEVNDLRDGLESVEERARMELGMVKQNEIFVQIVR